MTDFAASKNRTMRSDEYMLSDYDVTTHKVGGETVYPQMAIRHIDDDEGGNVTVITHGDLGPPGVDFRHAADAGSKANSRRPIDPYERMGGLKKRG